MTWRILVPLLTLLLLCPWGAAQAQVIVWKKGQTSITDSLGEPPESRYDWELPKKLQLTPAVETTPALKYRFSIAPIGRRPGDVKTHVDRVIVMYLQHPKRKELDDQYYKFASQLPEERTSDFRLSEQLQQLGREYLNSQADILKQLHYALSLDTVRSDYALRDMRGKDFFAYNLADIQNLRSLARLLQLECQLAVAEGRFDDAINCLRDGYRIAELALRSGEGTIVCQLVSVAIFGLMNYEVEQMSAQAGSPNLYWALASIPVEQLLSIRAAFEGESIGIVHALFPWGVEQATVSEAQAEERLSTLLELAHYSIDQVPKEFSPTEHAQRQAIAALAVVVFADRARQELNRPSLGNCQAVLEWTQNDFIRLRDDMFKWSMLPTQERTVNQNRFYESQRSMNGALPDSPGKALMGLVLPAIQATDAAVKRALRQHAFLITLEALRAYAAEHAGELPESLGDLRSLPAWSDPTTGKPFSYRRTDRHHAVLITEKSTGLPHEFHLEIVAYSVTSDKK